MTNDVKELLANPSFNVEEFIRNINIHYKNQEIVETLGSNAEIVLSIVESGNHEFLTLQPRFVKPEIFKEISARGHETWFKEVSGRIHRPNNIWYGVVINEDLAFNYRRISANRSKPAYTFEVHKSNGKPGLINTMRSKWKGLKMAPIGDPQGEYAEPEVYETRTRIRKLVKELGGVLHKERKEKEPSSSVMYFSGDYKPNNTDWRHARFELMFTLFQAGNNHVRVKVEQHIGWDKKIPHSLLIPFKEYDYSVSASEKFELDDSHLDLKVINWATKATKDNLEFRNRYLIKIEPLLKAAGIS